MRFRVPSLLIVLLAASIGTALAQGDARIEANRAVERAGKSGQVCGEIVAAGGRAEMEIESPSAMLME